MVVLVRRFDPSGETLPRWEPLASDGTVAFLSLAAAKKVALNPPRDADLHVGDLVAIVPVDFISDIDKHVKSLFVVSPDGVKETPKPPEKLGGPWLIAWGRDARRMLKASDWVDIRRPVMAACDCAEAALRFVPYGENRPRIAIETTRAWCRGDATIQQVHSAEAGAAALARDGKLNSLAADTETPPYVFSAYSAADAAEAADSATAAADAAVTAAAFSVRAFSAAEPPATEDSARDEAMRLMASLVERWIPLPVVLLSRLGHPNAIPFDPSTVPATAPRENPRPQRRQRRR